MKSQTLLNEIGRFCSFIDLDYQVNFVKEYAQIGDNPQFGGKHCGSDAEHEGSNYIAEELKKIGVKKVELLEVPTCRYQFNDAKVQISGIPAEQGEREIKPFGYASPGTDEEGITARLVDAGKATKEECENASLKGKIALIEDMGGLASENLPEQIEEAILHGAKALLIYATKEILDENTIRVQFPRMVPTVPVLGISKADALYLKELLSAKGDLTLKIAVDADFLPDGGVTYNVVGEIPGSISDEQIVYTAHLDHFFRCLQDNMASCATVLGIAKTIMDTGYKPKRTIIFAFHGSHECGLINSKYSYLHGATTLTHKLRPQWTGKTLAQINFEYTALKLNALDTMTTIGSEITVDSYKEYAPKLTGGFQRIAESVSSEKAAAVTYCDAVAYTSAGIPSFTNDSMSEQMLEPPTSPYCGRDHSNKDNWEIFEPGALADNGRFYGGLGIYLDQLPYEVFDFSKQTARYRDYVDFTELEENGIKTTEIIACLDRLDVAAKELLTELKAKNEAYLIALDNSITEAEQRETFAAAAAVNQETLAVYDLFQRELDRVTSGGALIYIGSLKHMETIAFMTGAVEYLQNGCAKEALEECLIMVDICEKSLYFSEKIIDELQKQIAGEEYADRRSWASGKETSCLALYDLMNRLKAKAAQEASEFDEEIELLYEAIGSEMACAMKALERECQCMAAAAEKLYGITKKMKG